MKKGKKALVTSVDEIYYDQVKVIAFLKKETVSEIVNDLLRTYIITNKAFVNEEILKGWKNK